MCKHKCHGSETEKATGLHPLIGCLWTGGAKLMRVRAPGPNHRCSASRNSLFFLATDDKNATQQLPGESVVHPLGKEAAMDRHPTTVEVGNFPQARLEGLAQSTRRHHLRRGKLAQLSKSQPYHLQLASAHP